MPVTRYRGTLALCLLAVALSASGCGRKNLPVSPRSETPLGTEADPGAPGAGVQPTGTQTFRRAARLSTTNDLTVSPAEVSRNANAPKKSFLLDPLLN